MDLAKVFLDTQELYNTNPMLVAACEYSRGKQVFVGADESIECEVNRFDGDCKILVSKKRSFEAAEGYARNGDRVAVLNFANSFNPGGGVVHGARAQEECLCRVSTLYDSLRSKEMMEKFYKPHCKSGDDLASDDIIYTPKVLVFKSDTDEPKLRPEAEWFYADVITCAAPCLEPDMQGVTHEELKKIHASRARHILGVACKYEADVLILGAFGCGAFSNPPEIVAEVYKDVLSDYLHAFKAIEFAVYCSVRDSKNYEVFKETFCEF
ncbi:MAG: TIGR02452 family protein [Treponema sp.]|nr:TIGR02452 family protein [Treponema sp.]